MQFLKVIYLNLMLWGASSFATLDAQSMHLGAEAAGLGNATVAGKGRMGIYANPAALGAVRNQEISATYDTRYGFVEGISTIGAAYIHPLNHSALALSVSRFGDQIFSQHLLSLSYGHQIDQFSVGIRANQHQYHMEGTNTRYATALDIGGIMQMLPSLDFGMSISNLNQPVVSQQTGERVPTTLSSGLCFRPDEKLKTLMEVNYTLEERPLFKVGIAYQPLKSLTFRSGVNTGHLGRFFMGMGLSHSVIDFDYALEAHSVLGISQQFNVIYKIKKGGQK